MSVTVGQLLYKLGVDTTQAKAELTGFSAMMGGTGMVAAAAAAGGVAVAAVGIAATKMAGDFQSGMTSLVTGAGESQKNIGMVGNAILKMARDTGTSTGQLTDGMYMIESAGYHGAAGLAILKAAAEGAKVGNADLGVVADATTTVMKDFGNTGITAAGSVNTLIATVANGKTHMADLASALSQVLPTASAAKVGLNGVMGAMATMTGEGVPAAEAATYLRQTMIALMAPSAGSQKALESIGLTTKQVADALHKSLPDALTLITDHLKKKFPEGSAAYVAALKDIAGGSKQMQGMLDLTGQHLGTFKSNTKAVADAVKNGGSSITGWSAVQKDFNQQLSRAAEVGQTLMIQLGQKLLPVATQLFGWIADNAIPTMKNFISFMTGSSQQAQILRPALVILAIAIGGALVASFVAWAVSAAAAAVATIAATWPILLIGAAIALLIAGIILMVTHWSAVSAVLGNVGDAFGRLFGTIGSFVGNALGSLGNFFGSAIGFFVHLNQEIPAKAQAMASGVIHWLEQMGVNALTSIGKFKDSLIKKGAEIVENFLSFWSALPGKMVTLGENILKSLGQGLRNAAGGLASILKGLPLVGGLVSGVSNIIPHFASGGTMPSEGLAMVGEEGPELVHLPAGASVTPNSQVHQGQLAALPAGMGTITVVVQPQAVTLNIDGRKAAQVIVPHIHTEIRNATGVRSM